MLEADPLSRCPRNDGAAAIALPERLAIAVSVGDCSISAAAVQSGTEEAAQRGCDESRVAVDGVVAVAVAVAVTGQDGDGGRG
jgi:hypothetical protein